MCNSLKGVCYPKKWYVKQKRGMLQQLRKLHNRQLAAQHGNHNVCSSSDTFTASQSHPRTATTTIATT